jgi:polysaccharide biosynthesis/export protein
MGKLRRAMAAAEAARALGVALWLAFAAFQGGCNSFLDDGAGIATDQTAGDERAEIARAASKYLAATTPGSNGYKIGPQDVLEITVFKAPDLSKVVQVADTGSINIPLVGEINAAGRTPSSLEREIESQLGVRYLKSPQVTVFVKEYNSQRVTVEGAVKRPGVYPLRGNDTLLQSIAKAEGIDRDIASSSVVVFHTAGGGVRTATRFEIGDIRSGNSPDPQVFSGDVIVVDDSMTKQGFQIFLKLLPVAAPMAYLL